MTSISAYNEPLYLFLASFISAEMRNAISVAFWIILYF